MKLITAIIQPTVVTDVQVALAEYGIHGITVTECAGYGRQHGHREVYRGAELTIDFIAKTRLEILVADDDSDDIIGVIVRNARTGSLGDGKVWATEVTEVVRIRTGEQAEAAL